MESSLKTSLLKSLFKTHPTAKPAEQHSTALPAFPSSPELQILITKLTLIMQRIKYSRKKKKVKLLNLKSALNV